MALDAVGKVGDTMLDVLLLDFGRVVAAIASIGSKVARRGMACGTRDRASTAVIQRKSMVKGGTLPGVGVVTLRAVRTKLAPVDGWFSMTRDARLRRILEIGVRVAAGTGHVGVCAGQLERSLIVIERRWLPRRGRMALRAVGAERAVVRVLASVTVYAVLRRILEISVRMAAGTGYVGMRADQLERSLIVVERGWLPRRGRMALRAVGAKRAVVCVITPVAIYAVLWRVSKVVTGMATGARDVGMRAGQLERSLVVVERGWLPRGGRMALGAVGAE